MDTLNELIDTGQARLVRDGTDITGFKDVVGWTGSNGEICIFSKVARNLTAKVAPTMQKVSASSLHKQLDERGYIKTETNAKGNLERTLVRKFNGKSSRVLVFKEGIGGN